MSNPLKLSVFLLKISQPDSFTVNIFIYIAFSRKKYLFVINYHHLHLSSYYIRQTGQYIRLILHYIRLTNQYIRLIAHYILPTAIFYQKTISLKRKTPEAVSSKIKK